MSNKEAYTNFAHVYDELMSDIPYDSYVELLSLPLNGLKERKIIDIGCGTGLLSVKLAKAGAEVTGIDLSKDMLSVAKKRAGDLSTEIEFVEQPMQEIEGAPEYDAAVIAIDSLNYLPDRESVLQTFKGVHSVLKNGGLLMFDVHSIFKTDVIFMEGPFTFDNDRIAYIWETEEGDAEHSVYSELAFFVKEENGLYRRFDESHQQRTFHVNEYVDLLREANFTIERIFADWEDEPPHEESERIFYQVRK
ncbi:class I SAM-dependent DNA methyltransferase [Sporosarcina highlanderae]|uniref:Class I SAM-dependent methyltransferase n=1 Tax=Sporosarcina highlanderae TaxID=3035916 RepID=A0ABT8JSF5_9BACL|nr:class I SAM-dependent methyltransferase [Sporosarcina highlanderae]MDN4607079.1 class I SAM-dependent methyltransferase [Sporosarcina highlanderae]